jgi:hypothetical protein
MGAEFAWGRRAQRQIRGRSRQLEILEPRGMMAGLLHQGDLDYLGAFNVPHGDIGSSTFEYGGTAIAYNPAKNSLFMVGHDWGQKVAEITIPALRTGSLSTLASAQTLQPFVSVLGRVPNQTLEGGTKIGGLMVDGNRLIGTAYEYYDSNVNAVDSHFTLSSTNLATAQVGGLYQVGNLGGGFVGGYMTEVPAEWRDELGTQFLTGQAGLSIISRTSVGPAVFGFDPAQLGANAAPADRLLMYTLEHPLAVETTQNPLFNTTTEIRGIVFPEGTDSVLFVGSHGTGPWWYGEPHQDGHYDAFRPDKGPHAPAYTYQVWAYDVHDLIAVKNGQKQFWQVQPYDVWDFDLPYPEGGKHIGGVAYDPASGRMYVSQQFANGGYPVIHAFQVGPGLSLTNTRASIAENTAVSTNLRVADIAVTGSATGLRLSGADQASFTIAGGRLYLKAGSSLNYEAKPAYNVTVAADAGTDVLSKTYTLRVTNVNEAPLLNASVGASLGTIGSDMAPMANPGKAVSTFISGISDPDNGALRGIAVVSLTEKYRGTWQYSINAGSTWSALGFPSDSQARLLAPSDLVRFLPKPGYSGTPQLKFRAWDHTDGRVHGNVVSTVGRQGGSGAYSVAAKSARLTVATGTTSDFAPILTLSGSVGYSLGAAPIVLAPNATVTDQDSRNFDGGQLRVSIRSGQDATNRLAVGGLFSVSSGNVLYSGRSIGRLTSNGIGLNSLVVTFNQNTSAAIVERLVRSISFKTTKTNTTDSAIEWRVSDGDGGIGQLRTKLVLIS